MCTGCCPELDVWPVFNDNQENYYQNLIGILRWAVDLGPINIHVEFSLLYSYLDKPRKLDFDQYLQKLSCLKCYSCSRIAFDYNRVVWSENRFIEAYQKEFYGGIK